jgi:biopolymer transport protein TolQ
MLLQAETGTPTTWVDLIRSAGPEVIVVLVVTGILSLASWFIIGMKWWQFRRIKGQSRRFFNEVEREPGLREAYRKVMKLPPSPFSRLFREGINFYSELKPGAMTEGLPVGGTPFSMPGA